MRNRGKISDMFGWKKKETKTVKTISHRILGNLITEPELHTETPYELTLFGKKYSFYLYIDIGSPDLAATHEFTAAQEETISFFAGNADSVIDRIERQLTSFFKIEDPGVFNERLSLKNVTISSGGELAVFFDSEFSDEELEKIDPHAAFTDAFGVVVYPEERMLHNEMECYAFDA